jgi:hypothetical protein
LGGPEVRLRAEHVQLIVEHDRLPAVRSLARRLRVELEEVTRQAAAQGLAAVGVHVQVVAPLAAEVGVALEHRAGVAVLEEALGQAETAQAAARDQYVQWPLRHPVRPPRRTAASPVSPSMKV